MRVRMVFWQELTGGFDGRVCGLHRDLRRGQIPTRENVQVRNLGERSGHCAFPIEFDSGTRYFAE